MFFDWFFSLVGIIGWAKAIINAEKANNLEINTRKCLSFDFFSLSSWISFKKETLEKKTFLKRLKLKRWIIIGMSNIPNANKKDGVKKIIPSQK